MGCRNTNLQTMVNLFTQSLLEINGNLRGKEYRLKQRRPYMKYREQDIFEELLDRLQPKTCLEWGSGNSTLCFPERVPAAKWISVENNLEWFGHVKQNVSAPSVALHHVDMPHFPVEQEKLPGSYLEDMDKYLNVARQYAPYDYIMIDGRSRVFCLEEALELIREDGVVVLHDANRKLYQYNFPNLKHQVLFTDYRRNAGGIWIGSKDRPISSVLNVNKHQAKWKWLNNFTAKILSI